MIILIDKKEAVLKKGTSFDFIAENSFFTGADSYTLSITFPIRGCAQNIAIFGHIYRKDFDFTRGLLACEIHDRNFHKYGSVSIVSATETEVKTQFLEGRSATNYYSSLDDIYINEITMPRIDIDAHWNGDYYLRSYSKQRQDEEDGGEYFGFVCLPWVNNTTGNIQNRMIATSSQFYYAGGNQWDDPYIMGFPFLVEIIRQVLTQTGYEFDLSPIENSQWANLVVCQGFPLTWDMKYMHQILPHWTVSEFLEQVELLLNGQFAIDNDTQKMTFTFNNTTIRNLRTVVIDKVVDGHQVEIAEASETKDDYVEQKNVAYADCEHQMWKFYSCDWVRGTLSVYSYSSIAAMKSSLDGYLDCAGAYNSWVYRYMHYCRAEDTYFVLKCVRTQRIGSVIHHYMRYQPINVFRPRIANQSENAQTVELRIVPACIDHTDDTNGDMLFIECGTLGADDDNAEDRDENQTQAVNTLIIGEKEKKEEYFDKIYVAFWDGSWLRYHPQMPHPTIDKFEIMPDNSQKSNAYSMRLIGSMTPFSRNTLHNVNQRMKFTFSFLSDNIPDVRSIFLIHGKKYMAEKITATFSAETGMSQLLKMTCYRLED
ncbi:MAG: hypothetical protein J6Y39_07185 [Bacteroidaceae bacterium]|nr:hypothetical protein [Bacteroidaceae bacterium]